MRINNTKIALLALLASISLGEVAAQSSRASVEVKIERLKGLMEQAQTKGIDIKREELAVHTALLFLDYADFDEANPELTLEACKASAVYKAQGEEIASTIVEWQRSESALMIEKATRTLEQELRGEIKRAPVPEFDIRDVRCEGASLVVEDGRPIYTADYNFMPNTPRYTRFYGDMGGYYFNNNAIDEHGELSPEAIAVLEDEALAEKFGSPFLGHNVPDEWFSERYPDATVGSRLFTRYDIDNPHIREQWCRIFEKVIPYLKGQNRTKLGYLLANEPHWHTAAKTWDTPEDEIDAAGKAWDTNVVSEYTYELFREWLERLHGDIETLNGIWGSSYASFADVELEVPVDNHILGTPVWYDWMLFNQWRVTQWFTFLITEIRKYDPEAIANVKVMPNLWTGNKRDHGLDFEAICELSDVIGNDNAAWLRKAWDYDEEWEKEYQFSWEELVMGSDMFRSFAPNKPNYNSEAHYLMHTAFQYLDLSPSYTRCVYWLSTMLGCDANTTWVWSRLDDGEGGYPVNMPQAARSHVGSVCTQPRVLNEAHQTFMDLNAHSYDMDMIQNLPQPIRIFYNETSAINKRTHMSDLFGIYEDMVFDGVPIGFATERILNGDNDSLWDVVVVYKSEFATVAEIAALQSYLDRGGCVILDEQSLQRDQYGRMHPASLALKASKGELIKVSSDEEVVAAAFGAMDESSRAPIEITQRNERGENYALWRVAESDEGRVVLSLVNIGNIDIDIDIRMAGKKRIVKCRDILTGCKREGTMRVKPEEVVFVEIL